MAGLGNLVLRPWIRELILGSETLSSPRAGQLLKVSPQSGPRDRVGTEAVRLTRVAAVRYCKMRRPQAPPTRLLPLTLVLCCLCRTEPTVSGAW